MYLIEVKLTATVSRIEQNIVVTTHISISMTFMTTIFLLAVGVFLPVRNITHACGVCNRQTNPFRTHSKRFVFALELSGRKQRPFPHSLTNISYTRSIQYLFKLIALEGLI